MATDIQLEDLNKQINEEGEFTDLEMLLYDEGHFNELCETGSVTITVGGKQLVVSLTVKEA